MHRLDVTNARWIQNQPSLYTSSLTYYQYIFQDVFFGGGVPWTSWGTRFEVGMTGADQRRYMYLRSDE